MKPKFVFVFVCAVVGGCSLLTPSWEDRPTEYTVKAGDTVFDIATRFRVSPDSIVATNSIADPKTLQIGTVLRIPVESGAGAPFPSELATERAPRASLKAASLSSLRATYPKMTWPVEGATLTSRFGYRLFRFHEGIDLSAPEGTPIRAALAGVVVYNGDGIKGYGNTVVVRHGDLLTVYGHNAENLVDVGDEVSQGETIATVGQTGRASGPHSHFEVRAKNDRGRFVAVDPEPFFR